MQRHETLKFVRVLGMFCGPYDVDGEPCFARAVKSPRVPIARGDSVSEHLRIPRNSAWTLQKVSTILRYLIIPDQIILCISNNTAGAV